MPRVDGYKEEDKPGKNSLITKIERNTTMLMIMMTFPSASFSLPFLLFLTCSVLTPKMGQSRVMSVPGEGVMMAQSWVLEAKWAYGHFCRGRTAPHGELEVDGWRGCPYKVGPNISHWAWAAGWGHPRRDTAWHRKSEWLQWETGYMQGNWSNI